MVEQSNTSTIELSIDWDQSGIEKTDINNVSIYAYPDDGSSPYLKVSGSIESTSINLPADTYTLLVFNDIAGDIEGLYFQDMDSYEQARIEMIEQSGVSGFYYDIADAEVWMSEHGAVAAWRMAELEITSDMVSCGYCDDEEHSDTQINLDVTPTPVTTPCTVIIGVENLNNAKIIQAVLSGFAEGIYLSTEERISSDGVDNIYGIEFTDRTYDDSDYTNGTVSASISSLGKSPNSDQNYELTIDVILSSGERVSFIRDVTEQVNSQDNTSILIELTLDDDKISLPAAQGMGFGVESWGDRESVELL